MSTCQLAHVPLVSEVGLTVLGRPGYLILRTRGPAGTLVPTCAGRARNQRQSGTHRLSTRCSTLHSAFRTLYSVLYTLYSILCTLYSVRQAGLTVLGRPGVKGIRDRDRRQGQGKKMQEQQRSQVRLRPTVQPINGSTIPISRPRTSRDAGPCLIGRSG